jgi:hypothetical protein
MNESKALLVFFFLNEPGQPYLDILFALQTKR